jgi:hypothetical protein
MTFLLIVMMPGVTPMAAASAATAAPEITRINNSSTRADPPAGLSAAEWDSILEQVRLDSEVAKLTADDGAEGDIFGYSVAISGDTLVVGAPWADVGGVYDQGAAYLFSRNQGGVDAWGQVAKLTADEGATGDYFG